MNYDDYMKKVYVCLMFCIMIGIIVGYILGIMYPMEG